MMFVVFGWGFIFSTRTAQAAGVDYTQKTFTPAPKNVLVEDEKYVYKIFKLQRTC